MAHLDSIREGHARLPADATARAMPFAE